jgi:aminobenzoyl-glutamate utilization protein B
MMWIVMSKEKKIAIDWVEENKEQVIDAHMKYWEWAEVGLLEFKTGKHMADTLEKEGFKVERGVAGMPSASVATYGSGAPVIGLMGELDALPGISNKAVPYKEPLVEGAAGHGCGHNSYAATALAAAIAVKQAIDKYKLKGTIKCFGTPAEETLVGKVYMIRDGVFDGVDACLGHHPGAVNSAGLGTGNAMNSVKFEFYGRSSHAASDPHNGISAMDGIELMNIGVNYLREHVIQETRMHYVVEDGGHEPNVVPPYARSWYYVRAPTRALVNEYYEKVLKIADGADLMAGTTHKVRFLTGVHNGLPNRPLAEQIVANMKDIGAPTYTDEEYAWAAELAKSIDRNTKKTTLSRSLLPDAMELLDVDINRRIYDPYGEQKKGGGGSSDVADVAWNMPTQQFSTAYFITSAPGHSWQHVAVGGTSIGHKSTIYASKVMAATAIDLMMNPGIVKAAKEDWEKRMEGQKYVSPLPADLKPPLDQLE